MPRVLKFAAMSLGVFVLTSALAIAQTTPDPGQNTGQKPTAGQTTHGRGRGRKSSKKKGHRKKGTKKPATTDGK